VTSFEFLPFRLNISNENAFRLGDKWKAKHYIELTLDQPAVTDDDKSVLEDAEKFYRTHFVLAL
jgi:hypothetical protein